MKRKVFYCSLFFLFLATNLIVSCTKTELSDEIDLEKNDKKEFIKNAIEKDKVTVPTSG